VRTAKSTESAAKPPKAEKSGAEKSEPADAYFSAPDVSALDSGWPREHGRASESAETSALFLSRLCRWAYENLRGKQRFWLTGTQLAVDLAVGKLGFRRQTRLKFTMFLAMFRQTIGRDNGGDIRLSRLALVQQARS
jgi:hypothetical protein